MQRLLFLAVLSYCFSASLQAQIYYETKWKHDNVTYTGLLIYYDDNAATMRVKYSVDGDYRVAEFDCFGKNVSTSEGNVYLIDGKDAKVVYGDKEGIGYSADNFIFMNGIGDNATPMHIDDNGVGTGNMDDHLLNVEYWRRVDTDKFTEQYVFNFYDKDEPMYDILLSYNRGQPAAAPGGSGSGGKYYITEMERGGGEWGVIMSKGHPYSRQSYTRDPNWPRDWIKERWNENGRITDLSYGDGKWNVTTSENTGLTVQSWKTNDVWPSDWVKEKWDDGFYITEVTYGDEWAVVASKNSAYTQQTWKKNPTWPRDWIKEKWDEGYKITSMDYGGGTWAVVMSKGSELEVQTWKRSASYPRAWIKEKWDDGYYIGNLAYGEGEWSVVMNTGTNLNLQSWKVTEDYPSAWIKQKWAEGGGSAQPTPPPSQNPTYEPSTPVAAGTKMHLIMVANSMIPDIGTSCEIDKNTTTRELEVIAQELGIPLQKTILSGQQFTKANLESALTRLNPGSNDVVIFVYTGHGFRWSDQTSKYPTFDLRYSTYQQVGHANSMNLNDVYNTIIGKGARLNLVLGDCCNSDIGVTGRGGQPSLASRRQAQGKIDKLRKLFLESRGNMIGAAARPNETSCGSTRDGGYFISSFFAAISRETSVLNSGIADWEDIITHTINTANYKTQNLRGCSPQNGIYYSTIK